MPAILLCVAGLPASGKSTVGALLVQRGWSLIDTGNVAADLLRSNQFHELSAEQQADFRQRAMALVAGGPPNRMARGIVDRLPSGGTQVVAVGLRHVSTLEGLRTLSPLPTRLLYVSTELGTCALRYAQREERTETEFYEAIQSPVEADQDLLRGMSEAVLDNNGSLDELSARLTSSLDVITKGPQ